MVAVKRVRSLLAQCFSHPDWVLQNLLIQRRRRFSRDHAWNPGAFSFLERSLQEALEELTDTDQAEVRTALERVYFPRISDAHLAAWDGSDSLLSLASSLTQLMRPRSTVETGVARGFTSAAILSALDANGSGLLYSVDLPALGFPESKLGEAVPAELKSRWRLRIGPSRKVLSTVLREAAPVDLFLHDADHTYESQIEEFEAVWPHLRPGGVLISDDVNNPAFLDFCKERRLSPMLIKQEKAGYLGAVKKQV